MTPTLDIVDKINSQLLSIISGDEKVYLSSNNLRVEEGNMKNHLKFLGQEILNAFNCSDLQPHKLTLKIIVPVRRLGNHLIECEILTRTKIGGIALIPRMNIVPNNDIVLIKFQRRQFLLMMSFGVKINKAQIENRESLLTKVDFYAQTVICSTFKTSVSFKGINDDEKVKQVIKGRELDYIRNLKYLVNLDLSNNFLSGSIPTEILSHSRLIGFNLSYNNLSGEIPKMIGDIKLSIDLSHNHFCGAIPRSMIDLTFLSHLNLSYNNLSGPIPGENQFQSLNDPLSYAVNQYLCGAPLPKHRPGLVLIMFPTLKAMKMKTLDKVLFYSIITLGFAIGFWGILGVLYFKKNWRYVCFGYVDKVKDKIYVAVVLKVAKLKQMVQRNQQVKLEV
ncbi:hypothetical protein Ahy_B09g099279 isoform A [Arachis hypogaea]|uniref:Uncharacterized protein n=1 Tax=Arachis hypogaea TaxID=3818 RepID=A0A444XTG8_ARAHY|nr:hypothetical protein Ahy_B09g099279 isoform A [Arachis hypogaea]